LGSILFPRREICANPDSFLKVADLIGRSLIIVVSAVVIGDWGIDEIGDVRSVKTSDAYNIKPVPTRRILTPSK
jgi:hypothetical protein